MRKFTTLAVLWLLITALISGCGLFNGGAKEKKLVDIAIWEDQATLHNYDLTGYLADSDVNVRRQAAIACGRVGDTMAYEALGRALTDRDSVVRANAALSLGFLRYKPAKPLLYQQIKQEKTPFALEYQLWAIGRLYGKEYADSLLIFLEHPAANIRGQAALTLGLLAQKSAADQVIELLDDPDLTVRRRAAAVLTRLDPKDHEEKIFAKANALDPLVRGRMALALGVTRDPVYYPRLVEMLADSNRSVRLDAARGLRSLRDTTAVDDLGGLLSSVDDPVVLGLLVDAMGLLWQEKSAPYLRPLKTYPDIGVRMKLAQAFLRSLKKDSFADLADLADDPAWPVRALLPAQLEYFAGPGWGHTDGLVRIFAKLASDSVPAVRASIIKSAMRFGSVVRGGVIEALHDPDELVRYYAITVLPFVGGAAYLDSTAAWYDEHRDDPNPSFRMAVLATLGNLSPSVTIGDLQRKVFGWGINDPDRLVRAYTAAVWLKFREDHRDSIGVFDSPINASTYGEYYRDYDPPPRIRFVTNRGEFVVELYANETPRTAHHILSLVNKGFYDDSPVGLNDDGWTTYLGDRRADSWGLSDETVRDEITLRRTERGSLVMQPVQRHDARSQFGICLTPQPLNDFTRTVFGKVVEGMDVVDLLRPLDTIVKAEVISTDIVAR